MEKPPPRVPHPPHPSPEGGEVSDVGFSFFVFAFVALIGAIVYFGIVRPEMQKGECIGWQPAQPIYRFTDDAGYEPEQRWYCVEWARR